MPNWVDYQRIEHSSFLEHVQHLLRTLWYTRKLDFWVKKKVFLGKSTNFCTSLIEESFPWYRRRRLWGRLSVSYSQSYWLEGKKNYLQLTFCPNRKPHVKRIDAKKPTTQDFPIFSPYNQSIGPSDTIWTMTKTIASFPLEWLRTHSQGKGPQ